MGAEVTCQSFPKNDNLVNRQMNKIPTKYLITAIIAELFLLISALVLIGISPYFWIMIGVIGVLLTVTAYLIALKVIRYTVNYKNQNDILQQRNYEWMTSFKIEYDNLQQRNYEWMQSFKNDYETTLREYSINTQNRLEELSQTQARLMQDNNILCNRIDNSIEKMCTENKNMISHIDESIITLKTSVDENTEANNRFFQESIKELRMSIDETDRRHGEILELGITQTSQSLNTMKNMFEENISDIRDKFQDSLKKLQEMINNSHKQSELHIESLADLFGNQTETALKNNMEQMGILRDALFEHSHATAASLVEISNRNAERLMSAYDNTVSHSAEVLAEKNESFHKVQEKMLARYLQDLSEVYNNCMSDNINAFEKQVEERIAHFTEENKQVAEKHNELTDKLLERETSFVKELETNNSTLRQTITTAFDLYSNTATENIIKMNDSLAANIEESAKKNAEHLQLFSDKQKETLSQFDEKLTAYSDSFVERSAQAVGRVQKDNNLKLQELSTSLARLANENVTFKEHCDSVNGKTNENIILLINHYEELKKELFQLSEKSVNGMNKVMNTRIVDMVEKLRSLNAENAGEFSHSMENYREKFVDANSSALASVQKDNLDAITDANKKVVDLAKKLSDLGGMITIFLNESKKSNKDFMENIEGLLSDKLNDYNDTSEEIKNSSDAVKKNIEKFVEKCNNFITENTESYKSTLKTITQSQLEANSLTEKDINLLKQLLKR